jgi:hypothetical protein
MTQPARFFTGAALQILIAEPVLFAHLSRDHIRFLHRKSLRCGQGQQVFQVERVLQLFRQLGLGAGVRQEGVELFERHR